MKQILKFIGFGSLCGFIIGISYLVWFSVGFFRLLERLKDAHYCDSYCYGRWAFWHSVVPGTFIISIPSGVIIALIFLIIIKITNKFNKRRTNIIK